MSKFTLLDGFHMNCNHPDTFIIPLEHEIDAIEVGDYVKLGFEEEGKNTERMWVEVTSVDGDNFKGRLDNEPFQLETIMIEDYVHFNSKHILAIYKD